jgi:histidine ammonia-lyase
MVVVDGYRLTIEQVVRVARDPGEPVTLGTEARERVEAARGIIEGIVEDGTVIYGVSTGFGRMADVVIPPEQRLALQQNLIRSHASGVGVPLATDVVRGLMLLRANALARGHSGCRVVVVETVLALLNAGIHPVVPSMGSVGASGDLAPLAHVALALMGEGQVEVGGETTDAGAALRAAAIEPVVLREKEGLALINGTQATTAQAVLALDGAERAVDLADLIGAASLEALQGTPEAFRPEVHAARPHPGQVLSGSNLRRFMAGSEIRESHREGDPRVQDAYCLRCMPQVHGAAREALAHVRRVVSVEINSATDNPLVFPEEAVVVSAGNFHAQVISQALDFLAIAVADLASISERRLERLLNPDLSGLPAFLAQSPGLDSGFMIVQVTVADILSELRVLAHPASVDSVPTSANQEDHISMGMAAGRKALRSVGLLEYVLAMEALAAVQGVEYHRPLRSSAHVERLVSTVRAVVPPLEEDRVMHPDLETVRDLVASGALNPQPAPERA